MVVPPALTALVVTLSAWIAAGFDGVLERRSENPPMTVQRMIVRDEIIIHVPLAQRRPRPFEWVERKGPKCVSAAMIAGAAMATPSSIDLVLRDRRRVRARFDDDCAGLDFYGSFYVEPRDGAVCAKREEFRSRAGASCRIERFRSLERRYKQ